MQASILSMFFNILKESADKNLISSYKINFNLFHAYVAILYSLETPENTRKKNKMKLYYRSLDIFLKIC